MINAIMPIRVVIKEDGNVSFPIGLSEASSHVSVASTSSYRSPAKQVRRSSLLRPTTEQLFRKSLMPIHNDISVSSRISGYMLTFISYLVLLVSTMYNDDSDIDSDRTTNSKWKHDLTLYGSVTFLALTLFIILFHFDTWMCPKLWRRIFRPGSPWECLILSVATALSLAIVFASTTSDGLGIVAALNYNVYAASWLGLLLNIYTFNLWLVGGVRSL